MGYYCIISSFQVNFRGPARKTGFAYAVWQVAGLAIPQVMI